jgi:hypothetical protein
MNSSTYPGYNGKLYNFFNNIHSVSNQTFYSLVLASYIREKTNRSSFRGFLYLHRDIVVSSSFLKDKKDWGELNRYWATRFLEVTKELLNETTFLRLKDKVRFFLFRK